MTAERINVIVMVNPKCRMTGPDLKASKGRRF